MAEIEPPAALIPDDKNWTWVLEEACPECGFDTRSVAGRDVAAMLPSMVERWRQVLARPEEVVRTRPRPTVWSPLEYACHVRDAFRVFDERFALLLAEDGPAFANWDQDATAVEADYASQHPAQVVDEMSAAGRALELRLAAIGDDQWQRPGYRSEGSAFTVETLARYFCHDPVHHLVDVDG